MEQKMNRLLVFFMMICFAFFTQNGLYSQRTGNSESEVEKGNQVKEVELKTKDTEFSQDDVIDENFENKADKVKKKRKSKKHKLTSEERKKIKLKQETKRHQNTMKQIKLMRKKAKAMLKKAQKMENNELVKHDKNVLQIKSK